MSKKVIIAATGVSATALGLGGLMMMYGRLGGNGENIEEISDETTPLQLPTPAAPKETSSSEPSDSTETKKEVQTSTTVDSPSSSPIVATKEQFDKGVISDRGEKNYVEKGGSWYFSSDSAISNIDSFDLSQAQPIAEHTDSIKDFLGSYNPGEYSDTKSSLRMASEKRYYANGKGRGQLTWFWSFIHNTKGFVTFNVARTVDNMPHKLKLIGGFYLVEKENDTGKIKYYQETNSRFLTPTLFNQYFPKPYGYTRKGGFDGVYFSNWSFVNGMWELYSICGENDEDCKGDPTSSLNAAGKWEGSGGEGYDNYCDGSLTKGGCDKVYAWSGDGQDKAELQWYEHMYGGESKFFDLKQYLSSFYKGYGRRESGF